MHTTPQSLLERFQLEPHDAKAWQELIDIYRPWLLGWLRAESIQVSDAEDIVQDVLMVLYDELPNFQHSGHQGAFRVWLRGIVVNRLRERRRSPSHALRWPNGFDDRLQELVDDASSLSKIWDREHDRLVLQRLLAYIAKDFEPQTWEIFRRFVLERKRAAIVAQELGVTVATVFTTKSRVMKRLRDAAAEIYPSME